MVASMTTTILLVRHGQTDWNADGRWQGHSDIPLNATGRRQAEALASRLSSWPVRAIYSSDLLRAAQTADIVGTKLGLKPVLETAWRERKGGIFEGKTTDQLHESHPEALRRFLDGVAEPPGGESNPALSRRMRLAYETIIGRHHGEMIAVVSHGGALVALISHILGYSPGKRGPISLRGNTGLTIVEIDRSKPRLTLLNDTCHLEGAL
jgi:broad specificity phosphatase PhoE